MLREILPSGDIQALIRWCDERFEISLSKFHAQQLTPKRSVYHCEDCNFMWLKTQLLKYGYFDMALRQQEERLDSLSVEMHVFFISLPETEEMLERLRREPPYKSKTEVARSKMFREDSRVPKPVDATADKVSR